MTESSYLSGDELQQLTQDWKEFKSELFGSSFTAADYAVSSIIGLIATGAHELLVAMPDSRFNRMFAQRNPELRCNRDGTLSQMVKQRFNEVLTPEAISKLEKDNLVAFDRIKGHSGLSGLTHRSRTLGHDPLLGLVFGVRDIMAGQLTKVVGGQLIVDPTAAEPINNVFKAISTWASHMMSDINTTQGLPIPGTAFIDWLSNGSYMDELFRMGMDLRHLFAQAIPVFLSDILVRLYSYYKRDTGSLKEAFSPLPNHKLRRLLLLMHSVNLTANLVITFSLKGGNPTNINWSSVIAVGWYGIQESLHWIVRRWKAIDGELERRDELISEWVKTIVDDSKVVTRQSVTVISEYDEIKSKHDSKAEELAKLLGITL
ncbi:hypothetical protein [Vibrio owensii]|uniref:hypothetical protein n=1 Tax=Vibrio owensii TaxID=696485 RepID=UPI0022DD2698|nr:hypothetical protein [Vibrio owensii]MDA0385965.1 hypothetical protein [Vibrio owensii]